MTDLASSGLVQQGEIRERVKKLQELFANDPDVARIDYRLAGDWSGDNSVFIKVVLRQKTPSDATITRLNEQIADALRTVVRSQELDLYSYYNFASEPGNGQ
jgi:hypothetical protein